MSQATGIMNGMDVTVTLFALLLALAAGFLGGWLLRARRGPAADGHALATTQAQLAAAEATSAGARAQLEAVTAQMAARLESQERQYRAQLADQQARVTELLERLDQVTRAEAERAESDGRVLTALSPVAERLQQVQAKVAELEQQRQRQYGELSEQLRQSAASEERLRATAETLASALTSNSTRGVWGETQLRSVVEAAGMIHRVDFDLQQTIDTDAGRGRPDMVVHLPGGKNIAVDAKVPFTAYLEASAIPATANGEELARRKTLLDRHVKALRAHIAALGSKEYWNGLTTSPEMVIAFIPSEGLVSAAVEADPTIMEFAFEKRVALSSPVTLWSVLKTVAYSWQQQTLTEDAKKLFDLSRELHGRLATTAGHLDKLGRSLSRSVTDYNTYVGSMERSVLPSARRLVSIDESAIIGELSEVDEVPRALSASELVDGIDQLRERLADDNAHKSSEDLPAPDTHDLLS